MDFIKVRGARTHNLKNIDVDIPINKITCLKGPSGSGKSSLAFHTLYSESKRLYINSMSDSFKFFSDTPLKADVDEINPVLPAFALPQVNPIMSSRSCVMDTIGLLEKLQKFFYLLGEQCCPIHHEPYQNLSPSVQCGRILSREKIKEDDIIHIFVSMDDYYQVYGEYSFPLRSLNSKDKVPVIRSFIEGDDLYEVFRFKFKNLKSLDEKIVELVGLKENQEILLFSRGFKNIIKFCYSKEKSCIHCGRSSSPNNVQQFSPYNALGACPECSGHGAILVYNKDKIFPNLNLSVSEGAVPIFKYKRLAPYKKNFIKQVKEMGYSVKSPLDEFSADVWDVIYRGGDYFIGLDNIFKDLKKKRYKKDVRILLRSLQKEKICKVCCGARVKENARFTGILSGKKYIFYDQITRSSLRDMAKYFLDIFEMNLPKINKNSHLKTLLKSMISSLKIALRIGLGHLSLLEKTKNLMTGEYQRLLMVKYLSYEGSGSFFIFDEPSLGLSKNEQKRLFREMVRLREQGNTILIVEHVNFFHEQSDEIIEMGPAAGSEGGEIIWQGKACSHALQKKEEFISSFKKRKPSSWIILSGLRYKSFERKEIKIPIHCLTQIKGDSSSGVVSLMARAFPDIIRDNINGTNRIEVPYFYHSLSLGDFNGDVISINSNMGRVTRRSTVGSFLGISPEVRKYYANLKISKKLGLKSGHFSTNSLLGKCPTCDGQGVKIIDMVYLEDIQIICEDCHGKGLQSEFAMIDDGELTSYRAFSLPMRNIIKRLKLTPKYYRIWEYIKILNLDYLSLSRPLNSLSGGERQRINFLTYLSNNIQNSLLIFENLSFGLSDPDLAKLMVLLRHLCDRANSLVIIDNHDQLSYVSEKIIKF